MGEKYKTGYDGTPSHSFPAVEVKGEKPRSGRVLTVNYDYDSSAHYRKRHDKITLKDQRGDQTLQSFLNAHKDGILLVEEWKAKIAAEIYRTSKDYWRQNQTQGRKFPRIGGKNREYSGCHLYITFRLQEEDINRLDLDNLLKPVLDGIKNAKFIIEDDAYIKDIKARKEIAASAEEQGVIIRCIAAKQFTIDTVDQVAGQKFKPYWINPVQLITATDNNGIRGTFIDNLPGNIFIDGKEAEYIEAIPGYPWAEKQTYDDCMATKRTHVNAKWKSGADKEEDFFWLQKWGW